MWCRTCSVLTLLSACGGEPRRVDVCGRGDRDELRASLAGGSLVLEALDGSDQIRARAQVPADGPHGVDLTLAGSERIRVTGLDADGRQVAHGEDPVGGGDACVCVALDPQARGACEGVRCRVAGDACLFLDAASGEAVGTRTLELHPVADATVEPPDGAGLVLEAGAAVMRFDLTVLPKTSQVDGARLALAIATAGGPVRIHRVLVPWEEDAPPTAMDFEAAPLARFFADEGEPTATVAFSAPVARWVSEPAANLGVALVGEGLPVKVSAREAGTPPTLAVSLHLPEDTGAILDLTTSCGNGLVDAGEACDDGDDVDEDGCTNACRVARCGDGIVRAGVEECDDGNTTSGDGCSPDCLACDDPLARASFLGANGHCYSWYEAPAGYLSAERSCDLGGHAVIAAFESLEVETAVRAGLGIVSESLWIGLDDRVTEDTFVWSTGAPLLYDNWAAGSPLAGDDTNDCVVWRAGGNWGDLDCNEVRGYVCEREPWRVEPDGRAYLFVRGASSDWFEARLRCRDLAAELVSIGDAQEQTAVDANTFLTAWTGLTEHGHDGLLAWSSGEAQLYDGFADPVNLAGDEYCTVIVPGGSWDLRSCAMLHRYVCESR